jgi:hypothetical protein
MRCAERGLDVCSLDRNGEPRQEHERTSSTLQVTGTDARSAIAGKCCSALSEDDNRPAALVCFCTHFRGTCSASPAIRCMWCPREMAAHARKCLKH